jgi:hypothetical protein
MGPVEILFITIGFIVTLIGLARGYAKELGNTTIILVAIFVLTFFETTIVNLLTAVLVRVPGLLANPDDIQAQSLLLSAILTVAFVAIVFASYAGRTLDMGGKPAKPPVGTIYTALIALLNGYLVGGTIWYYQHAYDYPLQSLGLVELPLTNGAQTMIEFLPQTIFPSAIYWMVPVAVLLLLRIRG